MQNNYVVQNIHRHQSNNGHMLLKESYCDCKTLLRSKISKYNNINSNKCIANNNNNYA